MVPKCLGALLVLFVTAQRFGEAGKLLHKQTANEAMVGITSVTQLSYMVWCTTGLNAYKSYNGYGCYCGVGGSGTPVDATDICCYEHDSCYDNSTCSNSFSVYSINYKWKKNSCATPKASINCKPASSYPGYYGCEKGCAVAVCNCDKEFAYCVQRNRHSYDKKYLVWDNNKC